ncbi:hypothetical protein ABFS82_10G105300 [Erythranthe guttata]|uniref:DNA-directed RNA polymerase III subunit RPC6 n=1 Tax=Erythranthe guttata TaxID=4155 RepID=A0A022QY75_ERYGU|nr:PREDICTED: DNA-directed RNA polymerase III subunit RPC6 [Erythranthe guttata]EYU32313.1 hypothetical protein MIMGU_mgv1a012840mg [Erythranthe guttata]|eukprot:XP_012843484.1 PREDICTED: DNA-directed RNA polymerase III subunit RPC6 [Erythranthe guttata]
MSRSNANLKRRRPGTDESGLIDSERAVLNSIKSKGNMGIWTRDIKLETNLTDPVVSKSVKSLMAKNLIKEVVNIQNKGKKHYMSVEFEPSKEISGGEWYSNGALDKELIKAVQDMCLRFLRAQKVTTIEGVHNDLKKSRVLTFEPSREQVVDILNSMVLDNNIIEVKSSGLGDYHSIPIGTVCYRVASGAGVAKGGPKKGGFASIPCGACPRISVCTPDGPISPATCVYYTKWLNVEF